MKIKRIVLNNFGLYSGKWEFDLLPNTSNNSVKPIILIGGLNGSGKTTLFDAIKLCLYGKDMFYKMSLSKYHEHLANKIHYSKSLPVQPNVASVGIEFEYSQFGEVNTYFIERIWEKKSKQISESLRIERDGNVLDAIQKDSWQDFIKELIPVGLSQLFFFDGEKIKNIMADNDNAEFKNSIKSLLGLDLIERLQADLKIYKTKSLENLSPENFKKEFEDLQNQQESIEEKRIFKRNEIAELNNGLLKTDDDIKRYTEKIAAQGGGFLKRRDELTVQARNLENELELIKKQIREIAAGTLPLCIASDLSKKLKEQVIYEETNQFDQIVKEKVKVINSELIERIKSSKFLSELDNSIKESLTKALNNEVQHLLKTPKKEERKVLFGLSSSQSRKLLTSIDVAKTKQPLDLKALTSKYVKTYRQLQKTLTLIKKAPDEAFVKPMYEKLNELTLKLERARNEKEALEAQLKDIDRENDEVQRKINKVTEKMEQIKENNVKYELTKKSERILSIYKKELAIKKIKALEDEFASAFIKLHRKKDMVSRIKIDPYTFDIKISNSSDREIKRKSLSSGEKEIYAISLLTALSKTSGHNLPFIIDTPLSRLDTVHRDKIVNNFFTNVSHQMVIFSTDTEIDEFYFNALKPYISRTYTLDYNQSARNTSVRAGYFWK